MHDRSSQNITKEVQSPSQRNTEDFYTKKTTIILEKRIVDVPTVAQKKPCPIVLCFCFGLYQS